MHRVNHVYKHNTNVAAARVWNDLLPIAVNAPSNQSSRNVYKIICAVIGLLTVTCSCTPY